MYQLLQNVAGYESAAQSFYQTYYTDILQHIFSVVTDSSHTAGQCNLDLLWMCISNLKYIFANFVFDI